MIKEAAFKAYCRQYETRIAVAEGKLHALKSGLQLTEACIRYALIEKDPDVK
jgi:hypothetical protein